MRLNKATTHAIRALAVCAGSEGELLKVSDLAEQLELTQQNAFKIVHLLSRAGFLQATRGRNGGVRLSRPADEIRVGEVVRSMEAMSFDGSEEGDAVAPGTAALGLIDDAFEAFLAVLNQTTIADMARGSKPAKTARGTGRSATAKKEQRAPRKTLKAGKTREAKRTSARV